MQPDGGWRTRRLAIGTAKTAIAGCRADDVAEIRLLGDILGSWRTDILNQHATGASNDPTEGPNLCVARVKRCGHGFRRFTIFVHLTEKHETFTPNCSAVS